MISFDVIMHKNKFSLLALMHFIKEMSTTGKFTNLGLSMTQYILAFQKINFYLVIQFASPNVESVWEVIYLRLVQSLFVFGLVFAISYYFFLQRG